MTSYDPTPIIVVSILMYGALFLFAIAAYVLTGLFLSRIFQKTGTEGWPAWVPVYNYWKLLEVSGQPGWYALLSLVPIANIVALVFLIIAAFRVGKGFGKSSGFVALYIFLPLIWMALLAHGRTSPWRPELAVPAPQYQPPMAAYPGYPQQAVAPVAVAPTIPSPYPGYHLENGQWVADAAPVVEPAPIAQPTQVVEPSPYPGYHLEHGQWVADAAPVAEAAAVAPALAEPAVAEPAVAEPAVAEPAVAEPAPAVTESAPAVEAAPAPVVAAPAEPSPYPGYHLENGQWVADAAPVAQAAPAAEPSPYPGYHLENGQWVPDAAPVAQAAPAEPSPYPGYHLENGQWVPDVAPQNPWAPPQS